MRWTLPGLLLLFSWSSFSQIVINEVCAANADVNIDPNFYNFSAWVELHNTGNTSANVGGYYLSDDLNQKLKWQIPASTIIPSKGFLLIWCDKMSSGLHTNFSLDADGESIVLSNSSGSQVGFIAYPMHYTNMSYARITDGSQLWRIAPIPTPQASNVAGPVLVERLEPPVFSKASGRYSGSQTIALSHSQSNTTIRYTIDGSEPTAVSSNYTSPIVVPSTRVLKAKAFNNNFLPSETVSNTYLIGEHASLLPVVSISTQPSYLWDNTIGIYADGTNGISGNCNSNPVNWNQDWDRHAVFEYFSPTGAPLVKQAIDIRIAGACSRNFPQKSFAIQPKKKYGSNDIEYPFFSTKKNLNSFGELFLRNSGNDFNATQFRDAFIQSLGIGQMDLDYMAYQPTVFYLNGSYWGIQNLREKIDGDFIESNYNIDKSDVDLLETWENAIEGTPDAWLNYKDSLQLLNPTDPNTFTFIKKHIDVQEYINYLVTEIYVCNTDWPGNNIKFWRQISTNGKFRWILWDLDFGFGMYSNQSYPTHPTLDFATATNGPGWPNPPSSTLHIRLVLANPEFRNKFIASMATAMGTTFNPTKVNNKINEFSQRIQNEVPFHKTRWGGDINNWNYEVQRLRDFASSRNIFMQSHVADFFNLGAPVKFSASVVPAGAAKIDMNGIQSAGISNAPNYKGVPFRINVIGRDGFIFNGWTITTSESDLITMANLGSSWKYFDQGTLPGATWTTTGFNDSGWAQGNAQLGYNDGDEATVVSYGPDVNNKFITTYFRKNFTVTSLAGLTDINTSVLFDDGVVVYLNGTEVYRNNMPAGAIANNTPALAASAENAIASFTIDKNLLVSGNNVFAVEIHQASAGSSDISFDFSASCNQVGSSVTYTVTNPEVYDTAYADVTMVANFIPVPAIQGLVLNEFSATKSFAKDNFNEQEDWIELYNKGITAIDLNGVMITDNLSVKNKFTLSNNGSPWLLQPNSYQMLWADDQVTQGKEHLSFKLSADGEELGLYHISGFDTTTFASLTFGPQTEGFSMARIPNGTGPFMLTSVLTPGAQNAKGEEPIDMEPNIPYPNPVHQSFDIFISDEKAELTLFDSRGKQVAAYTVSTSELVRINTDDFAAGLYILKLVTPTTNSTSRLVIVHP